LQGEQNKAVKNKDKAYWLKLEADLLADSKLSDPDKSHLNIAIKLYNKVIDLSPKKVSYRYHRGLLYERTQQLDLAENDFQVVIKKVKRPASALNALGFLLVKHTARLDEAKRYIKKAYLLKPNDPMILDSMGWVYFRSGEVKKAESYLRKAYEELKTPEVASHLIAVLSKLEKNKEAKEILNVMIKKHPNNASLSGMRDSFGHI
jgi:tetratricopeptide (TPR) repeat protein